MIYKSRQVCYNGSEKSDWPQRDIPYTQKRSAWNSLFMAAGAVSEVYGNRIESAGGVKMNPVVIGIAGPSGGGKSTIAAVLEKKLNARVFHTDSYFRNDLPDMVSPDDGKTYPDWNHPESIRYTDLANDIREAVDRAEDEYILVEGALLLAIEELRNLLDVKVFVDARIETCLYRRIVRNIALMGQTPEFIGGYYLKCARHREAEYCRPSVRYADYVIDNDVSYEGQLDGIPLRKK